MKLQKVLFGFLLLVGVDSCAMNEASESDDRLPNVGGIERFTTGLSSFASGATSNGSWASVSTQEFAATITTQKSVATSDIDASDQMFRTDGLESNFKISTAFQDVPVSKKCQCLLVKALPHVVRRDFNQRQSKYTLEHSELPGCYNEQSIEAMSMWARSNLHHRDDATGKDLVPEMNNTNKLIIRSSKEFIYEETKKYLTEGGFDNQHKIVYNVVTRKLEDNIIYCQPCFVKIKKHK